MTLTDEAVSLLVMMETDYDSIIYSPRKACKEVFPFLHMSTLQLWIRKGLLTPFHAVDGPSGPGTGTKLDLSDLVTIGVLHSMLRVGVGYQRLKADKINRSDVISFADQEEKYSKLTIRPARKLSKIDEAGRSIQEYLFNHKFKVTVHVSPYIEMKEPRAAMIHIYPSSDEKFHEWLCGEHLRDSYHEVLGHFFINCDTWFQYVCERICS